MKFMIQIQWIYKMALLNFFFHKYRFQRSSQRKIEPALVKTGNKEITNPKLTSQAGTSVSAQTGNAQNNEITNTKPTNQTGSSISVQTGNTQNKEITNTEPKNRAGSTSQDLVCTREKDNQQLSGIDTSESVTQTRWVD